jgi:hypothetical protein
MLVVLVVGPVPDPLLLTNSGSAGNRRRRRYILNRLPDLETSVADEGN